ncbi:MAG: orotate phosphoribosyltransferase [Candidatus Omnitrophota bacterium]
MSEIKKEEILTLFKETDALLTGHFELSSGLHSSQYLQCAKILQYPEHAMKLCQALAESVKDKGIDLVIGAATGGVIISFLTAYYLNKRSLFAERKEKELLLRRGFEMKKGERVLIVEDVITTGGTVFELIDLVKEREAVPAAICSLVNRSGGMKQIKGIDIYGLLEINVPAYKKEECPLCKDNVPVSKPGSKKVVDK